MANRFKNKSEENIDNEELAEKPSKNAGSKLSFVKGEKFRKILGISIFLFSIVLFFSIVSYLFTWKSDQDKLFLSVWEIISNPDIKVDNWLGKFGAVLAHQFVFNWFGIASLAFVPVFFVFGLFLMTGKTLTNLPKFTSNTMLYMVWTSVLLGLIFYKFNRLFGGAFGFFVTDWLVSSAGFFGASLIHLFALGVLMIIKYNFSFQFLNNWLQPKTDSANNASYKLKEEKEEIPVNVYSHREEIPDDKENLEEDLEELPEDLQPFIKNDVVNAAAKTDENDLGFEVVTAQEEPEFTFIDKNKTPEKLVPANTDELIIENPIEEKIAEVEEDIDLEVVKKPAPMLEEGSEVTAQQLVEMYGEFDPRLELGSFKFPGIDLLRNHGNEQIEFNKEELEANKNQIVDTLKNYNIGIEKIKATIGPTVTLYEIVPEKGVRISKIQSLEADIALSLAALGIRIIAPIPGKGTIGIEVPNKTPKVVSMKSVVASDKFQNTDHALPVILGKTITNEILIADLAKMPHLLMAGATGQGKSVGLNTILVSLLYKKHPSEIKFVLVDPKKVELTLFNKIERHYLAKLPDTEDAIITDTKKVVNTLNSLCIEMDNRYELLKDAQVRNIKEYNEKFINRKLNPNLGNRFLPYIVLVVDEFADLIMTAGKEVETPIARLAQLARAIGIHLIIATQRPSVNIITGVIKANFPARIAFRVSSKIDSRTILDTGGADQLIGRGDFLYSSGNDLIRLQCPFVDTPEVEAICEYIGDQKAYPDAYHLPEFVGEDGEGGDREDFDMADRDKLFDEAARLVVMHQQGSASLLQRRLKLGYNRAGRLVDQLEAAGILGPFEGSKARQVLIKDEGSLERFLADL